MERGWRGWLTRSVLVRGEQADAIGRTEPRKFAVASHSETVCTCALLSGRSWKVARGRVSCFRPPECARQSWSLRVGHERDSHLMRYIPHFHTVP